MTDDDRELLTAYLDGELEESDELALETRLSRDAKLRAEFDVMKQTWGLLDYLPQAEPSTDFTNRTMDRLTTQRGRATTMSGVLRRRGLRWVLGGALALLLGLGAGVGYRRVVDKKHSDDDAIIANMRLLERLSAYETVDDLDYLKSLADPDLFGDEEN